MQRKYPLDALAVRDAAHGESFVKPATLPTDHYAGEYLDSLLVSFHDAGVHAHAVPNRKCCRVVLPLFFLNRIDELIHNRRQPRGCGRTLSFEHTGFATRNCQPPKYEQEAEP